MPLTYEEYCDKQDYDGQGVYELDELRAVECHECGAVGEWMAAADDRYYCDDCISEMTASDALPKAA